MKEAGEGLELWKTMDRAVVKEPKEKRVWKTRKQRKKSHSVKGGLKKGLQFLSSRAGEGPEDLEPSYNKLLDSDLVNRKERNRRAASSCKRMRISFSYTFSGHKESNSGRELLKMIKRKGRLVEVRF